MDRESAGDDRQEKRSSGMFNKEKLVDRAMSMVGGAIPATAILYIGISINEAEIEHVNKVHEIRMVEVSEFMRDFRNKRILPDAEKFIAELQRDVADLERRIDSLETFKTQGRRCTFDDCKRIEQNQSRIANTVSECRGEMKLLKHLVDEVEKELDERGDSK